MRVLDEVPAPGGESARPLALVAEDNVELREQTVRRLAARGIASLAVGSLSQAANALSVSPCVDVALLDVHLDLDRERDDKGGIAIAQLLRSRFASTAIIGYSSHFNEDHPLSREEIDLFDEWTGKGILTAQGHAELWELCARLAQRSYDGRRDSALEQQSRLRRLYEIDMPNVEVLRRLQMDHAGIHEYTAEGALGLAGYRVKVITITLPERPDGQSRPLVVWEQRVAEDEARWVNLEVYGRPELYAIGDNEDQALSSLAALVALNLTDLRTRDHLSEGEQQLLDFLMALFA